MFLHSLPTLEAACIHEWQQVDVQVMATMCGMWRCLQTTASEAPGSAALPSALQAWTQVIAELAGCRIASCGGDRQLFLWDVGTGKIIRKFKGHEGAVNAVWPAPAILLPCPHGKQNNQSPPLNRPARQVQQPQLPD